MTTTASTLTPEIAAFAAAVRAELADLPDEEVIDLTDGLEADLVERHVDAPGEAFGDPSVYAAELRAAAGHPPRAARSHLSAGGILPGFRSIVAIVRSRWALLLERRPLIAGTVAMLASLRPAWWVFRGALLGGLLLTLLLGSAIPTSWGWLVVIAAIVVSVQIGRRRWLPPRVWMRVVVIGVDVALVFAIPFLIGGALNWLNDMTYAASQPYSTIFPDGLTHNGVTVSNIFAYDAEGNPIERVQLFDQAGEPINLAGDPEMQWTIGPHDTPVVPSSDVVGRAGWNVYPLWELTSLPSDPGAFSDLREPEFPYVIVRPLAGHESPAGEAGSTGEAAGD